MSISETKQQISIRPEDKAILDLIVLNNGNERLEFSADYTEDDPVSWMTGKQNETKIRTHVLADYNYLNRTLRTFPITTKIGSPYLFEEKYILSTLTLEDQLSISDQIKTDSGMPFSSFPSGFVRDPFDGFGLIYPLRHIIHTFSKIEDVDEIIFCNDVDLSKNVNSIRVPYELFDKVRKTLNRIHKTALDFAEEDKIAYLRGKLLPSLLPNTLVEGTFRKDGSVLRDNIRRTITNPGKKSGVNSNAQAAARVVASTAKELAAEAPAELYELNRKIELISLEGLISKFEEKLSKKLSENHWQKFLSQNPFILRLAFGYPISVFGEQVSVGGGRFNGTGGKLADYILRLGLYGNICIVEIKKPGSDLVNSSAYRGGVFAPSKDLSGSVTQVLDQKFWLQQEINQKKIREGITDIFAYAVQCVVIAGKSLDDDVEKNRSFEIYRNNLRDVVVITFDELLNKLKALHNFLNSRDDQDSISPKLLNDDEEEDLEFEYDEDEDLEN